MWLRGRRIVWVVVGIAELWRTRGIRSLGGGGRATRVKRLLRGVSKMLLVIGAESISESAWLGAVSEGDEFSEGGVHGAVGSQKL
jgi:hypothetical protein